MSLSLYGYSQLCCAVELLSFGISLLLIGNARVKPSLWLKWAKCAMAIVFLAVGTLTLVQCAFDLSVSKPSLNAVLNVTTLYTVTFALAVAFIPLADNLNMTRSRIYLTGTLFILCDALAWLSLWLDPALVTIALVSSLALYFVELLRIIFVFVVSYRTLSSRCDHLVADDVARLSYLKLLWHSVLILSLFALMYVFLVLWSEQALAVYNFASLVMWAYVFVTFVNLVVNYIPSNHDGAVQSPVYEQVESTAKFSSDLKDKLERWVASRAYCQPGVTMAQVAQQLGTNRTYLSRYINSCYSCNFNAWLTRLRIDEARRLLVASPTLSIEKVSMALGFSSKSQFINSFKAHEGVPPGQWREQHI